jgi:hypothetical protein
MVRSAHTRSDAQGRFALKVPPSNDDDTFDVRLRAGSGETGWSEDRVFTLNNRAELEEVVLAVSPPGAVEGTVAGSDGAGEPLVVVAAYDGGSMLERSLTDEVGRYRIDGLRPGEYLVLPLGPEIDGHAVGLDQGDDRLERRSSFDRWVRVEAGAVTQVDLDAKRDTPGGVEGVLAAGLDGFLPAYAFCARLAAAQPGASVRSARRVSVDGSRFAFPNLLPGEYTVWLETGGAERLRFAETRVHVRHAETTRAELAVSRGAVSLALEGLDARTAAGVRFVEVQAWTAVTQRGAAGWEGWTGHASVRTRGGFDVSGLPAARLRFCLLVPGFQAAWTQPVDLAGGAPTVALPVLFERGQTITVRLRAPQGDGGIVPERVSFRVLSGDPVHVHRFTSSHLGGERWALSGFAPGEFRVSVHPGGLFRSATTAVTVVAGGDGSAVEVALRARDG